MKKKLYLVKREVLATSIKAAMTAKGKIYEIVETRDTPDTPTKIGFKQQKTTPKSR